MTTLIDFRSDTVTRPSKAMLSAMMNAETGDDVYGEDPTVNRLESIIAERAGMEAAIFATSGTQTNLLGIMSHCERGDEYIVGQTAHTYLSEGGGAAVLASVQPQPLDFEADGTLDLDKVNQAIKPDNVHYARSKLLCLENTVNGKVLSLAYLAEAEAFCRAKNLLLHLDGARVFNAAVKLNVELHHISRHFDSVSICLSKGLGTPVGSVLCGSKELVQKARRWRKVLGGGMRQAGILAAAGIYALEHHVDRLSEDHHNASKLAEGLSSIEAFEVDVQTNMLFMKVPDRYLELQSWLQHKGIIFPRQANRQNRLRLVTHLDISSENIDFVIKQVSHFYKKGSW